MYALVDCNNFYVSCERLFNPKLDVRSVIVLSNHDGGAVSKRDEAKASGIEMAPPAFMEREIIEKNNVAVNGDISHTVMETIGSFVPGMEIIRLSYSFYNPLSQIKT